MTYGDLSSPVFFRNVREFNNTHVAIIEATKHI